MGPSAENFLAKYGSLHILTQRKKTAPGIWDPLRGDRINISNGGPSSLAPLGRTAPLGVEAWVGSGAATGAMERGALHLGGIRLNAAAKSSAALTMHILQGIGQ
ncbi:hypothetical protein SAMN05443247_07640 [Bradyrhizobium erythrophlei]|jgi:hypothetical protein|nr:hypothetical protein SAMN05443247_07640 [Bradyrhizobium erythrophlei]